MITEEINLCKSEQSVVALGGMMNKNFSSTWLVSFSLLILMLLGSLPVLQASTVGALVPVAATVVPQERPDVAYDVINNRCLVVYSEGSGGGAEIMGQLISATGALIGGPFNISSHAGQPDTQPAVAYKAATQEYLVAWRYGVGVSTNDIYARRVSLSGMPIGASIPIATTPTDETGPDVAADPLTTGRYLVVWWEVGSASNRGRFVRNDGTLDGGSFQLFTFVRNGPRVAYGDSSTADYFLTATTDAMGQALVRTVKPGPSLGPVVKVNVLPTLIGSISPALAFHSTIGRWLVVWVGQGGNQIRGRCLDTTPAVLAPADVMVVPASGPTNSIRAVDVAAGFETSFRPRFNVAFERLGEIHAVPLEACMVVGPLENLFVDMANNDRRPQIVYAKGPTQFFTVWQHDGGFSADIFGQRHQLP
jgi:hypothetical protein